VTPGIGCTEAASTKLTDTELTSAEVAAQHLIEGCLTHGPVGRAGLEIEAHCYDLAGPLRRPGWDELTTAISALPPLPGGSVVTVEPGGAVELSGPPCSDAVAAISAMESDRAVLRESFAQAGFGLVLLGADPLRPAARVNPGARYHAMEQFFDASQTGAAGAAMMTSTASIQVNVEAGPRGAWADRVRLAHALGPTMIAIAANSPMLDGGFTGWASTRQRRLHGAARRCVQAAAERVPPELEESMLVLQRSVEQGRSPADDFADRVVRCGIAGAVTDVVQGQL